MNLSGLKLGLEICLIKWTHVPSIKIVRWSFTCHMTMSFKEAYILETVMIILLLSVKLFLLSLRYYILLLIVMQFDVIRNSYSHGI